MRTRPLGMAMLAGSLGALGGSACNAFDDPEARGARTVRVVPTDERAPQEADVTALPVSGGTLLSLGTSSAVVASDPARDRVSVSRDGAVSHIELPKGSQPWRMAQLGGGSVAVSLRGSGKVVALDVNGDEPQLWEAAVCSAPRGLDFELATQQVHVACAGGELVSLDADTGEEVARVYLASDLRDVVAADERLYVSRFRAAEVLFVEGGEVTRKVELPTVNVTARFNDVERSMKPTVAWRMQAVPSGGVAVVHQRATVDEVPIQLDEGDDDEAIEAAASPYGGGGSSFSGPDCTSIVQSGISEVDANGAVLTSPSLAGVVLPVDMAVSPSGEEYLVANAGARDTGAPVSHTEVISEHGHFESSPGSNGFTLGVVKFHRASMQVRTSDGQTNVSCVDGLADSPNLEPSTAVAYEGAVALSLSTRDATILRGGARIALGGSSTVDTGHDLFHRDTGAGIACASCHPEGTDDGHVWVFTDLGPRRTQNLAVPLEDTAPFHWDGELPTVSTLMDEVFVARMGGSFQSEQRLEALQRWLFTSPQPVHLESASTSAAERGKALFDSAEVGCASCHLGSALTDNRSYRVGTSQTPLQVPSLVGLAAHPPFMHDGCAKTLEERFDPECGGGDSHGVTSHLSPAELDDLVAYMRTL